MLVVESCFSVLVNRNDRCFTRKGGSVVVEFVKVDNVVGSVVTGERLVVESGKNVVVSSEWFSHWPADGATPWNGGKAVGSIKGGPAIMYPFLEKTTK